MDDELILYQPFNAGYVWDNSSDNLIIADSTISMLNTYIGGKTQQATSVVSETNKECYQLASGCFAIYGFEVSFFQADLITRLLIEL